MKIPYAYISIGDSTYFQSQNDRRELNIHSSERIGRIGGVTVSAKAHPAYASGDVYLNGSHSQGNFDIIIFPTTILQNVKNIINTHNERLANV